MNEKQASIKVACVGAGYFSQFHYEAWARIANVELVASVNRNLEGAQQTGLPAFDNLDPMLETKRPDLLDIITPPETHLEYIKKAVNGAVKVIICQKPFCNNIEEAREAITICEKANVPLIVHENFRFQPWYRIMKQAIDESMIGSIHQLTFRLRTGDGQGPEAYLARQPYFQKMPRFLIHETGVHWLDTFRYLMGTPVSVYADLWKMNPVISGEDAGYFIMEFGNGKRAIFDADRSLDHAAKNCRTTLGECILEGTEGTITLSGNGELKKRSFGSEIQETLLAEKNWPGFAGDCVHALQSHVISGFLGKTGFENQAKDYLKVLELEAAVYASAETGQKIQV